MQSETAIEGFLQEGMRPPSTLDIVQIAVLHSQIGADVIDGDLAAVRISSARAAATAAGELNAVLALSSDYQRVSNVVAEGIDAMILASLARVPDGPARAAEIATILRTGETPSEAEASRVEGIAAGDIDPFEDFAERIAPQPVDTGLLHALLARGLLGLLHSAFNEVFSSSLQLPGVSEGALVSGIAALNQRYAEDLDLRIQRIWTICREDQEPRKLITEAILLLHFAAENAVRMARVAARGARIYQSRIEDGQGGAAEDLGRILTHIHLTERTMIASAIAANRIAFASRGLESDSQPREVIESAANLSFAGVFPNGVNRQLHQLDEGEDGRFVEIDARVVGMSTIIDEDDRLIGRIELQDPSSSATMTAVGLFINPARAGITVGAHFTCSGVFHQALELNNDAPGILIDRLAFSELAEEQWRIAFLRLGLDAMPVWRNGHNMAWAVGPHLFGGGLDPDPGGASETVFLDFGIQGAENEEGG
jgi:hypothetical protein